MRREGRGVRRERAFSITSTLVSRIPTLTRTRALTLTHHSPGGGVGLGAPIFVYRLQGAFGSIPLVARWQRGGRHLFNQPLLLKPSHPGVELHACHSNGNVGIVTITERINKNYLCKDCEVASWRWAWLYRVTYRIATISFLHRIACNLWERTSSDGDCGVDYKQQR